MFNMPTKAMLFASLCVVLPRPALASVSTELTISAAVSLKESLQSIQQIYALDAPLVRLTFNLGASGILEQQIEQGAPVDIFISASSKEVDDLKAKRLVLPGTRSNLLANTLVLICPRKSCVISSFQDLASSRVRHVAIANPESVPAGFYARQTLAFFRLTQIVEPKLVLAGDVRQALAYVETGNADAGIVYSTEAKLSSNVKMVATAPPESHTPIFYVVGVLKRSKRPAAAEEFVRFLFSAPARAIFEAHGFLPAGGP